MHEHLYQPGHAATARMILYRGWPATYLAECTQCGTAVDLVAELRRASGWSIDPTGDAGQGEA